MDGQPCLNTVEDCVWRGIDYAALQTIYGAEQMVEVDTALQYGCE